MSQIFLVVQLALTKILRTAKFIKEVGQRIPREATEGKRRFWDLQGIY
jgi:hypothetical protein